MDFTANSSKNGFGTQSEDTGMANWVKACACDDVETEDLIRFDHGSHSYAIYRSPDDNFYCTDGYCTHERIHLADGLVIDNIIECPGHNGVFDYRTGEAKRSPPCVALKTYKTDIRDGFVFVDIEG